MILKLKLAKGKTVDDAADTSNRNSRAEYDKKNGTQRDISLSWKRRESDISIFVFCFFEI